MIISETLKEIMRWPTSNKHIDRLKADVKEAVFYQFAPREVVGLARTLKREMDARKASSVPKGNEVRYSNGGFVRESFRSGFMNTPSRSNKRTEQ